MSIPKLIPECNSNPNHGLVGKKDYIKQIDISVIAQFEQQTINIINVQCLYNRKT